LYLFAAVPREDSSLPACVFEKPTLRAATDYIVDYDALQLLSRVELHTESEVEALAVSNFSLMIIMVMGLVVAFGLSSRWNVSKKVE